MSLKMPIPRLRPPAKPTGRPGVPRTAGQARPAGFLLALTGARVTAEGSRAVRRLPSGLPGRERGN